MQHQSLVLVAEWILFRAHCRRIDSEAGKLEHFPRDYNDFRSGNTNNEINFERGLDALASPCATRTRTSCRIMP